MSFSDALRARVEEFANHQCTYCRVPAEFIYAPMEIDHIHPRDDEGTDEEDNLTLSCRWCNGFKHKKMFGIDAITGEKVALFNPRTQVWLHHFKWSDADKAIIEGITPCGRATVETLKLNFAPAVKFRRFLVSRGLYPPLD